MNSSLDRAATYFWRATLLRCPECGTKPIFVPWLQVRSLRDWFTPLDGCPRCGYAYEREIGYFLLSIWAVNYGMGSILGITIYVVLEMTMTLSLPVLLISVISPIIFFNFLFARHSKAYFLAFDHYFDPHIRENGDDGGNKMLNHPPQIPPRPQGSPTPSPTAGVR